MLSPPEKQHDLSSASFNNGQSNKISWICLDAFHYAFYAKGQTAQTFLLAPPSDTLGFVLKSPSKLNIVRFFPLTDSGVTTNT